MFLKTIAFKSVKEEACIIDLRMKTRVLIFQDSKTLRKTLKHFLENLGYEVFTFSDPGMCPINNSSDNNCPIDYACLDIIISDVNMSTESRLELIIRRVQKGCKIMNLY